MEGLVGDVAEHRRDPDEIGDGCAQRPLGEFCFSNLECQRCGAFPREKIFFFMVPVSVQFQ